MKEAIQKAIEGGYKLPKDYVFVYHSGSHINSFLDEYRKDFLLDPLFWQCLGKAMGWEKYVCDECGSTLQATTSISTYRRLCSENSDHWDNGGSEESYKYYWYSLIDHIADGGDIDTFFNNLINK